MLQILYYKVFDIVNIPLDLTQYINWVGIFISTYFALFQVFNLLSERFRKLTPFSKKIHIVLQSVKFSNKIVVNIITLGCLLLWDERLLFVENWNHFNEFNQWCWFKWLLWYLQHLFQQDNWRRDRLHCNGTPVPHWLF